MEPTDSAAVARKDRDDDDDRRPVRVKVNKQPVTLPERRTTGKGIKEASIAQGVRIQLDFLLTKEADAEETAHSIDDGDEVTVDVDDEFTANDGDDDS